MWSKKANKRQISRQQGIPLRICSATTDEDNVLTGIEGISDINMRDFDLFLNTGWTTMAGNVKQYQVSEIAMLMINHCADVTKNAVRFFNCSPIFKQLSTENRCLMVSKSMVKVAILSVSFHFNSDYPTGISPENYKIIASFFPAYKV